MEQLIELLKQIQELSGVAIEALQGASKGGAPEGGGGGGGGAAPVEATEPGEQPHRGGMPPGR
jgi:hypothetical protein